MSETSKPHIRRMEEMRWEETGIHTPGKNDACAASIIDKGIPMAQITSEGMDWTEGRGNLTWVTSGKVQIDPCEGDYIGAAAHTNNTGEVEN